MQKEHLTLNQQVYYHDPKKGWLHGVITQLNGDKHEVRDLETQHVVKIAADQIHGHIGESYDPEDPDLFHVNDLHVATLLYCIKDRFEKLHQQYSLMGEMVLSVNPFQVMPFNSNSEREKYLAQTDPRGLPPHIWQVSHKAFNAIILHQMGNQSVVISGESGSGKTENAKMLISYLGQLSYQHSKGSTHGAIADKIDESLKWSNPVMETFGNARTVRNDNSSRFGKYIKLYFDVDSGVMMGGETVTYLLERSRIIMQSEGERNYHIFYEMLAGLSAEEKKKLGGLRSAKDYRCLNGGNTFDRRGVDGRKLNDAEEFETVRHALAMLGVDSQKEAIIFRILAAILHLMEVNFVPDNNDKAQIEDEKPFLAGCELLGLDPAEVRNCFLVKSHTNIVTILSTKPEADGFRNAFCKAIYVGLFDRIVEFVNRSIEPQVERVNCKYIGLLDIFGFENFKKNSFEQICINYANESLQNHYNKYTFINDEEECKREGIAVPQIVFPDNSECVHMFEEKPTGIFSMLDEECHFKGGNTSRFTSNLWEQWRGKNDYFVQPKSTVPNAFGVNHYASFVEYNTDDWLEKNTDALKEDMYTCVEKSAEPFIQTLLNSEKSRERRKQTVAIRFQQQLGHLRQELESTETQFIRCIKPNPDASPKYLDNEMVGSQLESAGVLQTIALKRQGYPVRRPLERFCLYFYFIMPRNAASHLKKKNFTAASNEFLQFYQRLYNWPEPNFAVGKTKVFLRAEVWSTLERLVLRRKGQLQERCKPYLRRWIAEYRERKRIELERRLAEQRRLREIREAKAAARANGLTPDQLAALEAMTRLFPNFDTATVVDVVVEADSHEEALAALLSIQEQRVDAQAPSAFIALMSDAGVPPARVQKFITAKVDSVEAIARISSEDLVNQYECSPTEAVAIKKQLHAAQAERTRYSRLSNAIGTPKEDQAVRDVERAEQALYEKEFSLKVKALVDMGFPEANCRLVLAHYNGDVQRTAARLLYGVDRKSINANVRKHQPYTTATAQVQRLMELGASKKDAKLALRNANGDCDKAVATLFKAK